MAADKLVKALGAVDWNANIQAFVAQAGAVDEMAAHNQRLAIWSRQFELADQQNPAICFVREMQAAGHLVAASTALCLYKAAAASMRTVVETALYYTYFRSHPIELATLVRNDKWYVSKDEILEYHKLHTPKFPECQHKLPVVGLLNPWYSRLSAIIHGQVPGVWHTQKSLADTKPNAATQASVLEEFSNCVNIVDNLFFCTVGRELWDHFATPAKQLLIKGMPGDVKQDLQLDIA